MNILNLLTLKSLKLNKKRTLVTIIGITLSVALICAITTFISSFQNSLIERTKITDGNFHIKIENLNNEESKYILNNVKFSSKYIYQNIGYSKLENYNNEYKPYIFLTAFDKNAMNNMGIKLIDGRIPENSNEVLIPDHILKNAGMKYKIGDTINLNIGERKDLKGNKLNQNNPYILNEKNKQEISENITNTQIKKVNIVGIIERPNVENFSSPGYTVITYLDNKIADKNINVAAIIKNPKETYKLGKILENDYQIKYNENKSEMPVVSYNDELLRFSAITNSDNATNVLITMASIVILIIVFTSVFVIKNSFSISISERLKQYGMLSSIGATSKQIKKNIMFEGLILGVISIPLGVILGIFSIWIVLIIVSGLLINTNIIPDLILSLHISIPAILVAVIISIITIYISTIIPARKASKISAIDAIRETKDIKITSKSLKTSKLFYKIFGIEGVIASKNLKRSRSKYKTTIFSICISIVLFISISSIIDYGFKVNNLYYKKRDSNIIVYNNEAVYNKVPEYFTNISKLSNIDGYTIKKSVHFGVDKEKYGTDDIKKTENNEYINVELISLGDLEYRRYIKKLGLKYEDTHDKGILIDNYISIENGKRKEANYLNVKEGQQIEGYDSIKDDEKIHKKINILFKTDIKPLGLEDSSDRVYVIVSDENMNNFEYICHNMYIKSSDPYKLEEDIIKLDISKKNAVTNMDKVIKEENSMVLIISIFLYGFIAVISVIGITNIFNTITTNMSLRNREFAILKSIGMTNKEFNKMINFESILYGLKALIFGIPIGIGISYLIYAIMKGAYETTFMFPINAIIISIIFVFIIIFSTMRYSINKTKKQNIIEVIRNENI